MKRRYQATYGKCVAMTTKIRQGSKVVIPLGDVQYLFDESSNEIKKFAIRSPLTHEWISFEISSQYIREGCFTAEINRLIDYYEEMTQTLQIGRIFQPMKDDLTPLDLDECRLFGLKDPRKYARSHPFRS